MNDIERRVQQRAKKLWKEAGRPAGGSQAYVDQASELVAIEDSQMQTTEPLAPRERAGPEREQIAASVGPEGEPVEPIEAVENAGEFPTLTDQGEQEIPHRRSGPFRRRVTTGRKAGPRTAAKTAKKAKGRAAKAKARKSKAKAGKSKSKARKSAPARRTTKSRKTASGRKTATRRRPATRKKARRARSARKKSR